MEILLKQGDRLPIPDGCKAVIEGDVVLIEEKENEFKDGDVLHSVFSEAMAIFKESYGRRAFRSHYNTKEPLEDSGWLVDAFRLATDEEKQLLFDKMKEQGLRWNAEEKKVEKIRWRAGLEMTYYSLNSRLEAIPFNEDFCGFDDEVWDSYNYFRTPEQAEKAAEVMKEALRKFHEENK